MRITYLKSKKLANGDIAYYTYIPKHLIPKGCDIKSSQPLGKDEILASQKALDIYKQLIDFKKNEGLIEEKSFRNLWNIFQTSHFYNELAPRTKRDHYYTYKYIADRKSKSGRLLIDTPLDNFDFDSAYALYEIFVKLHKTHGAKKCISLLRQIYNFGMLKGILLKKNPFEKMRLKNPKPKKEIIPREHILKLIEKAKEMKLPQVALAIELNYYLCQRPADLLELRSKDVYKKGDYHFFNIIQNKTKTNVKTPIPPHLVEEILRKKDYIIFYGDNKPYTVNLFQKYFKKVSRALGYDYTFRLLRHSGSTAYAEAGVNTSAIISLTGHTNESIFNTTYKGNSEEIGIYALEERKKAESRNGKIKE